MSELIALYPHTTSEIMHQGQTGNIYRLDGFDKCVRLSQKLSTDPKYKITSIYRNGNEALAIKLIASSHSPQIISSYETGKPQDLANSSGVLWQEGLYDYVLESALCCKYGVDTAIENGVSLVISGGGHHAEYDRPLGFCTINTMAISALYSNEAYDNRTVLIDLDVHYSNGCFDILKGKKDIFCSSLWNKKVDKWKYYKSEGNVWHQKVDNAAAYFDALQHLTEKVQDWSPTFAVHHLGMDVLASDRMGGVEEFDVERLYEREQIVSRLLKDLNIPYVIFLGGAYIDYSKGEEFAQQQKALATDYQEKALQIHLR